MTGREVQIAGTQAWLCAEDGAPLASGRDASDILGDAMGAGATLVAIPTARLDPEFLRLASGLAGEVLQKFVNYGLRVAIVGDVSAAVARSKALADFVGESNRGKHVWFVADRAALEAKLTA